MAEPIAFDSPGQVDELVERLQETLQAKIAESAATSSDPQLASLVKQKLQEKFDVLRQALLQNVSVAGQPYHEEKPSDMEAFDEALNRNFVTYETKVNESIAANTSKRKEAPRKAASYADSAFAHYAQAREALSEQQNKIIEAMKQDKKLLHARIPDREASTAQYREALEGVARLQKDVALQQKRAEQALQVQRDLELLRVQSGL